MTQKYNISLLPALQEQTKLFKAQCEAMAAFCEQRYGAFMAFVDEAAKKPEYEKDQESFEYIYDYAAGRLEGLQSMMNDEIEITKDLEAALDRVAKTGDQELWHDVSSEMINDGEYRESTAEFKAWVEEEMEHLRSSLIELLTDWEAAIAEGDSELIARFIEAAQSLEEEEEGEACGDECEDGSCDDACDDEDGCCDRDDESCCGRQTPCCRMDDEETH